MSVQVKIKKFELDLEVKNNGMELEIKEPGGKKRLGDLTVTKTGLTWNKGKAPKGKKVKWEDFIKWMEDDA